MENLAKARKELHEKIFQLQEINTADMTVTEKSDYEKQEKEIREEIKRIDAAEVRQQEEMRHPMPADDYFYGNPENASGHYGNPGEIRLYNKSTLKELRNHIISQDRTGITDPVSFGKFARGLITGNWKGAEAEKRALGTADSGGNYLVPEIISGDVILMALNKAQVMNAGAIIVPMDSKTLVVPRIIKMPETQWKGENLAFTKSMDMNFDGVTLVSKTLMALISLSAELAEDGIGVEATIENAIAQAIALEVDRACLLGSGGLMPLGINSTAGVLAENLPSPITDYEPFTNAYYRVEAENGTVNSMIAASSVFQGLDLLVEATNKQPLRPPESWSKYKQLSSNQLTDMAIQGDYSQLLIGMRNTINLEVARSTETAFKNLQVWVRAYIRMDCAIKNVKHFCVIKIGASGSVSNSASASSSPSASASA